MCISNLLDMYKKLYKSHNSPYQVLQVTCAVSEHANEVKGSYDIKSIPENISLVCCLCTRSNIYRRQQTHDIFQYT